MYTTKGLSLPTGAALIYGLVLSFIPLLRELHFLSAALTALIAAFSAAYYAGGLSGLRARPSSGLRELLTALLLSLVPALPLLAGGLLRGCFSFEGLSFWLLLPPPSVLFGFAIGRYFRLFTRRARLYSMLILLLIALGGLLIELLSYPQVYFHNHVWGYWPGPIYDEQVALTPAVLFFRLITLSWAGLFWLLPAVKTGRVKPALRRSQRSIRLLAGLLLLSLLLSYSYLSNTGIISPPEYLQQRLGERTETEFSVLYHDASLSSNERRWIAAMHDFHIREIAVRLELDPASLPTIHSYIYRHAWQKKRLTGAGNTVYVPVWQPNPQLHIQKNALEGILRHELVHVIAREFGMPVLNASPNIALVEGLAVALQGARNAQATLHQVVAAQPELPDAARMQRLMSPTGFYALSGSLSYTLAGSFVDWLLQEYPVAKFKEAYRSGRLSSAYDADFESLIAGWHAFLEQVPVHETQLDLSDRIFGAPGIIEKSCVFHISAEQRALDNARQKLAEQADSAAYAVLGRFANANTRLSSDFLYLWGRTALRHSPDAAQEFLQRVPASGSPRLQLLKADAHFITGNKNAGTELLQDLDWNEENGGRPKAVTLRLEAEYRPYLLALRYVSATALRSETGRRRLPAFANLPDALKPYALQMCLRMGPEDVSYCRFAPPETRPYRYRTSAEYQLMEAYTRQLFALGHRQPAERWLHYLSSGLQQAPQSEILHAARLQRLGQLARMAATAE